MLESYGKVYLLWDPTTNAALTGPTLRLPILK